MAEQTVTPDTSTPDAKAGSADATAEVRNARKTRVGFVSSDKMDKTITVKVERRMQHPLYGKFITRHKKFHAHDERNECKEGDLVRIMETRPLSKLKRWRLIEIIEKAV